MNSERPPSSVSLSSLLEACRLFQSRACSPKGPCFLQDVDLDAALFDAGMDWDGTSLETCFFDDQFPTDGTVPSLSDLSSDDLGLAGSASCSR